MCGIVGYLGQKRAAPVLLDGLEKLEYRGYDSAGIAVLNGGKFFIVKRKGRVSELSAARALAGKPEILILDDSASALDFATDAALRRALKAETQGMTVLMVSQRVSTVKAADRILVLDDGTMAGLGTHEELMESCEVYREICLSQLSREEAAR